MLLLASTSVVTGLIDAHLHVAPDKPTPFTLLYGSVYAVLIYRWCNLYAQERGTEAPLGSSIVAAYLPQVGIPVYFFRLLPMGKATIATLKAAVIYIGLFIGYSLAYYCAELVAA